VPTIVRWEWGRNLHDPRPLHAERLRLPRLGPLKAPPVDPKGYARYGFDAAGRLAVVERYQAFGLHDTDTWTYGPDAVLGVHRTAQGVETKSRLALRDGRPVEWRWDTLAGPVIETYEWTGDRVTRVRVRGPNDPPRTFEATWGPDALARLTSELDGTGRRVVIWERDQRPLEELSAEVLSGLELAVRERLASVPWEQPAWALLLVKSGGYDALPPELVVGVGSRWLGEAGRELPVLQARDERSLGGGDDPLALLDPALLSLTRQLANRARAAGGPGPLHAVLDELARRLVAGQASLPLPRAADFVVLVVDLDEGVRSADLAGVRPDALQRLRRSGLVR
jgi:hypothetical protein